MAFTRTYLIKDLKQIVQESTPEVITKVHVDDTAMISAHPDPACMYNSLVPAALTFHEAITKLKLKFSDKKGTGAIICSSETIAKVIQNDNYMA